MSWKDWMKTLFEGFSSQSPQRAIRKNAHRSLHVEVLEERAVPATLRLAVNARY